MTSNWFFVLYAQIKTGGALLAGYRVVGTHIPSGSTFESAPSCSDLCKASGPRVSTTPCCNESCTPEAASLPANVQEGNVALEAPIYDTGTYYIRVLDPQGQQVSDTIEIPIDINDRKWFFYVFAGRLAKSSLISGSCWRRCCSTQRSGGWIWLDCGRARKAAPN